MLLTLSSVRSRTHSHPSQADRGVSIPIAATVDVTPVTVRSWRTRFAQEGLAKFSVVRGGRGRKPHLVRLFVTALGCLLAAGQLNRNAVFDGDARSDDDSGGPAESEEPV